MVSSWFCFSNPDSRLVKILDPNGHEEVFDRPVLAAEINLRNPGCVVAYPNVYKQPWAIVPPETMLMPGQKFYCVPTGTIRKLQKFSMKYPTSPSYPVQSIQNSNDEAKNDDFATPTYCSPRSKKGGLCSCSKKPEHVNEGEKRKDDDFTCWSPRSKKGGSCSDSKKIEHIEKRKDATPTCWSPRSKKGGSCSDSKKIEHINEGEKRRDGCSSDSDNINNKKCLSCLPSGMAIKCNRPDLGDDCSLQSSVESTRVSNNRHRRSRSLGSIGSPRKSVKLQYWEPSLASIREE